MSRNVSEMLQALDRYERTGKGHGLRLRLNLAEIILRQLRVNGWTQRDMARRTGFKEPFISRILHSNANCTFDTAGKLLSALGVDARIIDETSVRNVCLTLAQTPQVRRVIFQRGSTSGKETCKIQGHTETGVEQALTETSGKQAITSYTGG